MKRFPVILAPALLGSLLMLGGCATTGPNTAPLPPDRDCQEVYTVAPGNYIIDIAGGSMVVLDPAVQDFPLFCSPEEARAGLKTAMDNGALPAGDWRIYRLNGTLQEIGQQPEPGHYSLARMARLVDWVSKAETEDRTKNSLSPYRGSPAQGPMPSQAWRTSFVPQCKQPKRSHLEGRSAFL